MKAQFEAIEGRYVSITADGRDYRIFVEFAGQGIPLLCLHTAAADSRQYRHLMNDPAITAQFQVIAFDMPYHGRSNPPQNWWLERHMLTTEHYLAIIRGVWLALGLDQPVVMGCSMGGAIVLKLAADYQNELRGIIGLEATAFAPGRFNDFTHHPAIHGGEMVASFTLGLNAPGSPEANARENWWYYAQSGPGVYRSCTHFYSIDFDAREDIRSIDTKRCKVSLLTGEFDYSGTPAMAEAVAAAVPGARYTLMRDMGHFPMVENYPLFRDYLLPELAFMAAD